MPISNRNFYISFQYTHTDTSGQGSTTKYTNLKITQYKCKRFTKYTNNIHDKFEHIMKF